MRIPPACQVVVLGLLVVAPPRAQGFSVLAHQAVVDATWESAIVPELRRRFPGAGTDLERARSFAHGGSHIADLGYFPLGNPLFTNIVHYVRTGDFIETLLASARTADEYAFALGAAAHYIADTTGHAEATNRVVPMVYPDLREKHGDHVTYADDHGAHLLTEFRFDVLHVARNEGGPDVFHHSLQFQVAQRLLNEAFQKTYGLELEDLFASTDAAILTYRFGFRALIHEVTGIAWQLYEDDIRKLDAGATPESFVYDLSREDFEKEFGSDFAEPGYFAKFVAFWVKLLPNWGPFERAVYNPLPPEAQEAFAAAMEHAVARYRDEVVRRVSSDRELRDVNLDTGAAVRSGDYEPADEAYAGLVEKLAEREFANVPEELRADIRRFYEVSGSLAASDQELSGALARLESTGSWR
jgi:hypothetical protein